MKKNYSKPVVEVHTVGLKEEITALVVSENALNWVDGTYGNADSVDWD